MNTDVDRARVRDAVADGKVLSLVTHQYFAEQRSYVEHVLEMYLHELGKPDLHTTLAFCIHELAGNAKKANAKRVYYQEKGLDIHNPSEYHVGMQGFKDEMVNNIGRFVHLLERAALFVKFQFKREGDALKIAVRNNTELTPEEQERIQNKLQLARKAACLPDIWEQTEDYTEGAGQGLAMCVMMFRSLGIPPNNFQIFCREGETVAVMYIKLSSVAVAEPVELAEVDDG